MSATISRRHRTHPTSPLPTRGWRHPIPSVLGLAMAVALLGGLGASPAAGLSIELGERLSIEEAATPQVADGRVTLAFAVRNHGTKPARMMAVRVWGPGYSTLTERRVPLSTIPAGGHRRVTVRVTGQVAEFRQPVYLTVSARELASGTQTLIVDPVTHTWMRGEAPARSALVGLSKGSPTIW